MLQAITFRIVCPEELLSLLLSCSRLGRLLKTRCSPQKWAATQHSHSVLSCSLQQLPELVTQKPKDSYCHAPQPEALSAPRSKGNEVGGGREDFTSRSPNPHRWSHTFRVWWNDSLTPFSHWTTFPVPMDWSPTFNFQNSAVHPKCFTGEGGQKYRTNRNSISNII